MGTGGIAIDAEVLFHGKLLVPVLFSKQASSKTGKIQPHNYQRMLPHCSEASSETTVHHCGGRGCPAAYRLSSRYTGSQWITNWTSHDVTSDFPPRTRGTSTGSLPNNITSAASAANQRPTSSSRDELIRHQEEVHNICPKCHEMLDTVKEIEDHKVFQHDMCRKCGRFFRSLSHLLNVSLLPLS